jgi:hypothetical protein
MTTPSQPLASTSTIFGMQTLSTWLHRTRAASAPLYWAGLAMLALCLPLLVLPFVDTRLFQGVSVWLKPLKFALSTGVYLLTLALFVSFLPRSETQAPSKSVRYLVWAAVLAGSFEVFYIVWQGARAEASHFNTSSALYIWLYSAMGVGAVLMTSSSAVLAVLLARRAAPDLSPALRLSIVLGLALTFVLGTGFGGYLSAQRAGHWVGGALSDAGGLPLLAWSTSGGDLRVAHFFGIHAMHFIPGFAVIWSLLRLPDTFAKPAVWAFASGFTGLTVWTFLQARAGTPLFGF